MKKYRLPVLFAMLLLVLAFLPNRVSAKDQWLQVRSKNFNLIGNAAEKDIRKVAARLEQFRETFRLLFTQANFNSAIPINVVVFKSSAAYKPFKPKRADGKADNFIAGYFQPGEDVNYITLSTEGDEAETYGIIFHEYVHSIIDTTFGESEVPPWFNEGLAEYYQTFAIAEDQKVKLGLPQSSHLRLLQQSTLIPLETLFKISNDALHQNGDHSRSIFYAEAWALIHYLLQSGKSAGLEKFLSLSLKDIPSEKAFQDAFRVSYAQMENELRKYVEQNSYKYTIITLKSKLLFDAEMQTLPLSEAESYAYLGDLLYHTNRDDDAEPFLQKAIALNPNLSQANTTYGMVKLRGRKYDEAKKYLEKAISEDQKNHLAFYNYAYLLSREDRDEFGYVAEFSADKSEKMRELLKKAIAVNPSFTQSYELLAFVNLVNNEQLDEAVSYLQKALKYEPGNQRYAQRIAEIYMRQNKYEAAIAEVNKDGAQTVFVRRNANRKQLSPEEAAKAEEEAKMRSLNQAIKQAKANEKQIVGRIQKIECKSKAIAYSIKTDSETFTLSSRDFESLTLTSFVTDAKNAQIGCEASIAGFNTVLTYKPQSAATKPINRGELIAVDFVPNNFRFIKASVSLVETQTADSGEAPSSPQLRNEDLDAQQRAAMMQIIKNAMRQLAAGEKRELGFIEKVECDSNRMIFYFKTQAQPFELSAASPLAIQIRAFTPEVEQLQLGCGMKQVDIPVVFTYKEIANAKNNINGELVSMEFVPKSFVLEK